MCSHKSQSSNYETANAASLRLQHIREEMTHMHKLRTTKPSKEVIKDFNMVLEVGSNFGSRGALSNPLKQ